MPGGMGFGVSLHSSNLESFMSALGHSLPRHPTPAATNVRYASNSDGILRPSEMTRWAISGLMHRSKNSKTLLSCAGSTHQTRVSGLRDTNDTNSMTGNIGTIPIAHTMSALPHERPVTLTKQENSNA